MRVLSWNVNGLRAIDRGGRFRRWIDRVGADIVAVQEARARLEQLPPWTLARNDPGLLVRNDPGGIEVSGSAAPRDARRRSEKEATVFGVPALVSA